MFHMAEDETSVRIQKMPTTQIQEDVAEYNKNRNCNNNFERMKKPSHSLRGYKKVKFCYS